MAPDLSGKRVAILATDGVERMELEQPRGALYGAGADTELLSIHSGEIKARQFDLVPAGTFPVDKLVTDASPNDYDALLLPGLPEEISCESSGVPRSPSRQCR
jgi:protease I